MLVGWLTAGLPSTMLPSATLGIFDGVFDRVSASLREALPCQWLLVVRVAGGGLAGRKAAGIPQAGNPSASLRASYRRLSIHSKSRFLIPPFGLHSE